MKQLPSDKRNANLYACQNKLCRRGACDSTAHSGASAHSLAPCLWILSLLEVQIQKVIRTISWGLRRGIFQHFRRFHSTMNKGLLLSSGHMHTSRRSQMILPGYDRTRKVAVQLFRSHSRASIANPCIILPSNVSFRPAVRNSVNPSQLYRTARRPPKRN